MVLTLELIIHPLRFILYSNIESVSNCVIVSIPGQRHVNIEFFQVCCIQIIQIHNSSKSLRLLLNLIFFNDVIVYIFYEYSPVVLVSCINM